ncbi:MAG: hypothetical protein C0483_19640 [Pirellula sp.]|nr:hypothetical protein [Pirellula sp.]
MSELPEILAKWGKRHNAGKSGGCRMSAEADAGIMPSPDRRMRYGFANDAAVLATTNSEP